MQEFVQKHWKKIVIGGLAGTAAILLICLNEDDKPQSKPKPVVQGEEEKKSLSGSQSLHDDALIAQKAQKNMPIISEESTISPIRAYEKKVIKIPQFEGISPEVLAKQINVLYEEDILDLMTISQIFEKSVDLAKQEYVNMTYENRRARRKLYFNDKKKYTTLVIDFLEESENIINKASDDLLSALNIPKETFENSCMALMERGFYQQMFMLQAAIRQKMKEFLVATKPLTLPEIKPLLKYQLTLLNDKQGEFTDLIDNLKTNMETVQMIPLGINVILSDLIYEKYEVEEEDQMSAMKDPYVLMKDQELHSLLMASEQTIQTMLGNMGMMAGMPNDMGMGGPGMY